MERKLSNKDKAEAYYMRLEGHTLQEIADKYGVTKQALSQFLPHGLNKYENYAKGCIYPAIARWMIKNKMSYLSLSKSTGVNNVTLRVALSGKSSPTKFTIDGILKVTGLTYEEAFSTEETENG